MKLFRLIPCNLYVSLFVAIYLSFFVLLKSHAEDLNSPVSSFSEVDEFVYDPVGRRDPFKPWRPFAIKKAMDPKGSQISEEAKLVEITNPLLKHEVERYSVLAIMWDIAKPRALIKDPEGKSHVVFQGSLLGRNGGSIRSLREGEVVITERVDVNGERKATTKILEVNKNDIFPKIQPSQPSSQPSSNSLSGSLPVTQASGSDSSSPLNKALPTYFEYANEAMTPAPQTRDVNQNTNSRNKNRPSSSQNQSPKTMETQQ